jgi:hypothetical protein
MVGDKVDTTTTSVTRLTATADARGGDGDVRKKLAERVGMIAQVRITDAGALARAAAMTQLILKRRIAAHLT